MTVGCNRQMFHGVALDEVSGRAYAPRRQCLGQELPSLLFQAACIMVVHWFERSPFQNA
jgi:hypothetical protein